MGCLRHLLTGLADRFGWLRGVLSGPWKVVQAIEREEPNVPRSPMPVTWLEALVVSSLTMRWFNMAAALLLGFFALLRPAELYGLRREDILTESEHHMGRFLLVRLKRPKSRWRGAAQQYVRVDEPRVVQGLTMLLKRLPRQALVWPMSPSRFAMRLKRLSEAVIGKIFGVLPSSLRTGGATWFFQASGEHLTRLLWRGRWRDARVLGSYIQEITAAILNARLSDDDAHRVASLAAFFGKWLSTLVIQFGDRSVDDF